MDETQTSDQTDQAFDAAPEAAPALPPFVTAIKPAADIRARIQEAGGLSLDRLPMLHVVFDRLATACSDAAKHWTTRGATGWRVVSTGDPSRSCPT